MTCRAAKRRAQRSEPIPGLLGEQRRVLPGIRLRSVRPHRAWHVLRFHPPATVHSQHPAALPRPAEVCVSQIRQQVSMLFSPPMPNLFLQQWAQNSVGCSWLAIAGCPFRLTTTWQLRRARRL